MSTESLPILNSQYAQPVSSVALTFELLAPVLTRVVSDAHNDPELRLSDDRVLTALNLSSIWSYLCFDMDWLVSYGAGMDYKHRSARTEHAKTYIDFLLLCLTRSGTVPLDIRIRGAHTLPRESYWPRIVALIASRVETLEIDCGSSGESDMLFFDDPNCVLSLLASEVQLSLLSNLSVRILDDYATDLLDMFHRWDGCALSSAPNLKSLHLERIPPAVLSNKSWTRLEVLWCDLTRLLSFDKTLCDIASLAPGLTHLNICSHYSYRYGPGPIGGDTTEMVRLMERDTVSKLETLYLCDDGDFSNDVFRAFFQMSTYESITVLGMPTPHVDDEMLPYLSDENEEINKFLSVLQFLPNVVRVDFRWNSMSSQLFELWAQHDYVVQLPKLRHLRVTHATNGRRNCVGDVKRLCSAREAYPGHSITSSSEWTLDWVITGDEVGVSYNAGRMLAEVVHTVRFLRLRDMDRERYNVVATFRNPSP
ncbi:hypothetical protein BKA62DRAFT_721363 [Auriculariales sp. MPI-PUGE-AT-0066]|nr:hypothetical protein BKA62DRAFT_721363 [Auriculariales sp. MPI-PUGE-AT-0066]